MSADEIDHKSRLLYWSAGDDASLRLVALAARAEVARAAGRLLEAAELYSRAIFEARILRDRDEEITLLIERANCQTDAGDLQAAERDIKEAERLTRG